MLSAVKSVKVNVNLIHNLIILQPDNVPAVDFFPLINVPCHHRGTAEASVPR